jgi:hypothetical protein
VVPVVWAATQVVAALVTRDAGAADVAGRARAAICAAPM